MSADLTVPTAEQLRQVEAQLPAWTVWITVQAPQWTARRQPFDEAAPFPVKAFNANDLVKRCQEIDERGEATPRYCPNCGESETLSTVEQQRGTLRATGIGGYRDGTVDLDGQNGNDIIWGDIVSVGVECDCGWFHDGECWPDRLSTVGIPDPDNAATDWVYVETVQAGGAIHRFDLFDDEKSPCTLGALLPPAPALVVILRAEAMEAQMVPCSSCYPDLAVTAESRP